MGEPVVNISPRGRARRARLGVVMLAVGVALGATLVLLGAGRGWRLLLFVPLWVAVLGFAQARAGT